MSTDDHIGEIRAIQPTPKEMRSLPRAVVETLWLKAQTDLMHEFYHGTSNRDLDTRHSYRGFARLIEKYMRGEIDV